MDGAVESLEDAKERTSMSACGSARYAFFGPQWLTEGNGSHDSGSPFGMSMSCSVGRLLGIAEGTEGVG
eukprot:9482728-Pyramimonas_sp.AAC.1